jgi:hypothetical protein
VFDGRPSPALCRHLFRSQPTERHEIAESVFNLLSARAAGDATDSTLALNLASPEILDLVMNDPLRNRRRYAGLVRGARVAGCTGRRIEQQACLSV